VCEITTSPTGRGQREALGEGNAPMNEVRVVPPDSSWPTQFRAAADEIGAIFLGEDVEIHHIGSTAIRGIYAKPIIDILLLTENLSVVDRKTPVLQTHGYEALGEFGIVGRRYFRKHSANGVRTHHVHSFVHGSMEAKRHLAFRDYMNAHPTLASEYSVLKQRLAREYPSDMDAYMDGKDSFIKLHEAHAMSSRCSLPKGETERGQ
jgi:GrpB-like predicted nucleotidyltransferase (UPF0157 family)